MTLPQFRKLTPYMQEETVAEFVEAEMPRPVGGPFGGFETADLEEEYKERTDARYLEVCGRPELMFAPVGWSKVQG